MELKLNSDFLELGPAPFEIQSDRYSSLTINLEDWSHAFSKQMVRIKSIIQLAKEHKLPVKINYPTKEDVKHSAGRVGLFKDFSYNPQAKHKESKFFSIYEITNDRSEVLYEECHRILSFSEIPSNFIDELADAFTELSDNVYFHSGQTKNSGKGFAHVQVYEKNIKTAIDDCGVGFFGSYKRADQVRFRSELQIIEDAFEEMESSLNINPKNGHRGLGLFSVKNLIKKYGGKITVISGRSRFCMKNNAIVRETLSYQYKGTNIELEIPRV